ncbi:rod shape-determining protein MreC [Thiorhodococcus fuscus]|uniref:Cell shape-determining protein MreC n=1 Tax=Thiorhodococcus fuscus TaxID=527200 RepID=A0ABW4Y9D7_9GAMM
MFAKGPSPTFRVIAAVLLAFGLIIADHRYHRLDQIRSTVSVAIHPMLIAASEPAKLIETVKALLTSGGELRGIIDELHRENLVLKARLQQFEALEAENSRLRDLLGSSLDVGERVLIAEIRSVELAPYRQQVVVNKGTRSGVFVGQPVLDANAVMGQVIQATPFSSIVLLITDVDHALPVEINRNGLRTIAAGTGLSDELELLYIPKNADVRVGDLLVTSGLDGRFPAGYPVARVTKVRQDPANPFTTVIAAPTAKIDRSREVLLVWTLDDRTQPKALAGEPPKTRGAE